MKDVLRNLKKDSVNSLWSREPESYLVSFQVQAFILIISTSLPPFESSLSKLQTFLFPPFPPKQQQQAESGIGKQTPAPHA